MKIKEKDSNKLIKKKKKRGKDEKIQKTIKEIVKKFKKN